MEPFQYIVWKDEKRDKDGDVTEKAQILVEPKVILAADAAQASVRAAREIPEEHLEDLDRVKVVVRPF